MVRACCAGDLEQVYQLLCLLEGQELNFAAFQEIFLAQCSARDWVGLVWEEEGEVLAFLNLRLERQLHHAGWVAEILELVTHPSLRGRGIGARLMQQAKAAASRRGCQRLEVACNVRRKDAHHFYQKCGLQLEHYRFGQDNF